MFQLDNATVTIYAVANARHKLRQLNALQVKQMFEGRRLRVAKRSRQLQARVTVKAYTQHGTRSTDAGYTASTKSATGCYAHRSHGACT